MSEIFELIRVITGKLNFFLKSNHYSPFENTKINSFGKKIRNFVKILGECPKIVYPEIVKGFCCSRILLLCSICVLITDEKKSCKFTLTEL